MFCISLYLSLPLTVSHQDAQGDSALMRACRVRVHHWGHAEAALTLLRAQADPQLQDRVGMRALHLAARFGRGGIHNTHLSVQTDYVNT